MSYISSFSSLEDLSEYYQSTLYYSDPSVNHVVVNVNQTLTPETLSDLYPNVSFTSKFLSALNDNLSTNFVAYPISKTQYRNSVHSSMISSFYKLYYDTLKKNKYIVESTAFSVILIDKPITQEVYDSLQSFSIDEVSLSSSMQSILRVIDSYNLDTKYYQQQISSLKSQLNETQKKLQDAEMSLYNKTISTWY